MRKPHEAGRLNRIAKRLAPLLSPLLMRPPVRGALRLLSIYLDILQGKGSGAGWDLQAEVETAARFIRRPQPVIFDIGANRGDWTSMLLNLIGVYSPRFYLFEPSSACQAILRQRCFPNSVLIPAAVGDQTGEADLLSPTPGSPVASLYCRRDTYHLLESEPLRERTSVVTVDGIMAEYGVDRVDFMKIDVEGHELAVLTGARQSLEEGRIAALSFEFGSGQINARAFFHDFWDLLHPLRYDLFRICPGGALVHIDEYYEDLESFRGVSNYLATAPGKG